MYKDRERQRETQKERQRRYRRDANLRRDKQGVTDERSNEPSNVIPKRAKTLHQVLRRERAAKRNKRGKDIKVCFGSVVVEPTGNPEIYDYDPEYDIKEQQYE